MKTFIIIHSMALPEAWNTPSYRSNGLENIDDLMTPETAKNIENEHKFDLQYQNHGMAGITYKTKNPNTILKISESQIEAISAKKQMKINCPSIVKIYSINQVQESPSLWKIEMEKVIPISDKKELKYISYLWYFYQQKDELLTDLNELKNYLKSFLSESQINETITQIPPYIKNYNQMISSIKKCGFQITDAHGGNIGKKQGYNNYVLFDLDGLI